MASKEDLLEALQKALELEHSTIPPYLFAFYTIRRSTNREAWERLHSIFVEEMLHMTLVCNIMNAIEGGRPRLAFPDFVPNYPTTLPLCIGGEEPGSLVVHLKKFSLDHVRDTFMEIEEPETPLVFPEAGTAGLAALHFETIGQFYANVTNLITTLGEEIFHTTPTNQISPGDHRFEINDQVPEQVTGVQSAIDAIKVIVEQGEGTGASPLDNFEGEGEFAHYYQFEELVRRKKLTPADNEEGYTWGPEEVEVDESSVQPVVDNPKMADLDPAADGEALEKMRECNIIYTKMLKQLDTAFSQGNDTLLRDAVRNTMTNLSYCAEDLVEMPLSGGGNAGPSFEWLDPDTDD